MWLLDAETKELKFHADERGKGYAILSHTWGEDEVSFQDLQALSDETKLKKGYNKILSACAQALEDDIRHVWIDTCCIDKTSSAELTESINSMYRWYYSADICYAYLHDANPLSESSDLEQTDWNRDGRPHVKERIYHMIKRSIQHCRWFTRGWTLQELIAPREVVFFGPGWKRIANKSSITDLLSNLTKIERKVLESRNSIAEVSVSRKMSWAARRKTTRIEDRAYSLLGLFNVNIPLLYGEAEKAFVRLQEEIIRTSVDHSIFLCHPRDPFLEASLLAFSPDDFDNVPEIDWWGDTDVDSSYQFTNQGLRIRLKLVRDPYDPHRYLGALNCRYKNDYSGPLALCLFGWNEAEDQATGEDIPAVFHVAWQRSGSGLRKRARRVTLDTLKDVQPTNILILRHGAEVGAAWRRALLPKVWLSNKCSVPLEDRLEYTKVFPTWNVITERVFDSNAASESATRAKGCAFCKGTTSFLLAFQVTSTHIDLNLYQADEEPQTWQDAMTLIPFEAFQRKPDPQAECILSVPEGVQACAKATRTRIMGEDFYVIEVWTETSASWV